MPLIDLQNEMFTGDLNDSGRGRGIRGLSGINPLNSTPDTLPPNHVISYQYRRTLL